MAYYEQAYNTATPALDIMTNLQTWMPANGYTFVETYTSGTNISDVYKSPGTSNSFGTDFYIGFNRTATTATTVAAMVFEQWDAVNKKAIKYAPATGAASMTPASDGSVNDSGVLLSATTAAASCYKSASLYIPLNNASWVIYVNININRIIWGSSNSYVYNGYAGLYDSFSTNNVTFPLCVVSFSDKTSTIDPVSTTSGGSFTRDPWPTTATTNFGVFVSYTPTYGIFPTTAAGAAPTSVNGRTGLMPSALVQLVNTKYTVSSIFGSSGTLKDVVYNNQGTANTNGGDTLAITVGATTYNYVKPANYTTYKFPIWIPKQ